MRIQFFISSSIGLILAMLALAAQGAGRSESQLNSITGTVEQADFQEATLSNSTDGIQIDVNYYDDLAVVGLPVSFIAISKNASSDVTMIYMDPDMTIKSGNDPMAFWYGHTHTGDFRFEYTSPAAGTYSVDVDFLASGDTVNFMGEEFAFGNVINHLM